MKNNNNKILIVLVVVVLIIFSVFKYEGNKQISKKEQELLDIKDKVIQIERERLREKDSLNKINSQYEKQVENLTEKILISENKIVDLQKENSLNKERVAKLNYIEVAQEINSHYNTSNAVATDVSVNLNKDLPNKVLETVYEADYLKDVIVEKDNQLIDKDSIISYKDKIIVNKDVSLISAEREIEARKLESKLQDDLNKQLKRKNKLNKYLVPVSFIVGAIIGNQIK